MHDGLTTNWLWLIMGWLWVVPEIRYLCRIYVHPNMRKLWGLIRGNYGSLRVTVKLWVKQIQNGVWNWFRRRSSQDWNLWVIFGDWTATIQPPTLETLQAPIFIWQPIHHWFSSSIGQNMCQNDPWAINATICVWLSHLGHTNDQNASNSHFSWSPWNRYLPNQYPHKICSWCWKIRLWK